MACYLESPDYTVHLLKEVHCVPPSRRVKALSQEHRPLQILHLNPSFLIRNSQLGLQNKFSLKWQLMEINVDKSQWQGPAAKSREQQVSLGDPVRNKRQLFECRGQGRH